MSILENDVKDISLCMLRAHMQRMRPGCLIQRLVDLWEKKGIRQFFFFFLKKNTRLTSAKKNKNPITHHAFLSTKRTRAIADITDVVSFRAIALFKSAMADGEKKKMAGTSRVRFFGGERVHLSFLSHVRRRSFLL